MRFKVFNNFSETFIFITIPFLSKLLFLLTAIIRIVAVEISKWLNNSGHTNIIFFWWAGYWTILQPIKNPINPSILYKIWWFPDIWIFWKLEINILRQSLELVMVHWKCIQYFIIKYQLDDVWNELVSHL